MYATIRPPLSSANAVIEKSASVMVLPVLRGGQRREHRHRLQAPASRLLPDRSAAPATASGRARPGDSPADRPPRRAVRSALSLSGRVGRIPPSSLRPQKKLMQDLQHLPVRRSPGASPPRRRQAGSAEEGAPRSPF